ncbi:MAG TPA: MFS transporter [Patescibacteria group bacterium]|nr:MFS transporter [Patescibacteria group bacterium]
MTVAAAEPMRGRLPLSQLLTLSIYWLGILTIWGGLDSVVIPQRLLDLDRGSAGTLQAIIAVVGVVAPIIIQPTVGVISDYTMTRWGRRKPYILIGTVLDVLFVIAIATSNGFLALAALYFLLQLSSNFAQGPFQGYVPDLVPASQVGLASGLMGMMIVFGTILGTGIATLGQLTDTIVLSTIALAIVELGTMVLLVLTVDEGSSAPQRTRSWREIAISAWGTDILRERSVLWLLLVRLLFLGAYAVTRFVAAYFEDSHGMARDDATIYLFIGTLVVGLMTAAAAIPGGRLSDRFGRRPVIWSAAVVVAIGLAGVAAAPTPELGIAAFVPFGIGMGIFLSADWALMADVIPKHTAGRYMGILNAGTAMAGPAYLVVAGPLRDAFDISVGPRMAIAIGIIYVAGAALALTRVDPRRRELEDAA